MNKYNMKKQIKETSFWKPEKISSTRVIRGNPLFDFPGSKQSNPRKQSNNKSNMLNKSAMSVKRSMQTV